MLMGIGCRMVAVTNASRMTVRGAYIHHGCILAEDCAMLYSGNIYTNGTTWERIFLHDSGQVRIRSLDNVSLADGCLYC